VACATKNAKGNKCQTGHRHNGTAITLAVIAKFGEAFEAGAAKLRPFFARRGHVAFWPVATDIAAQANVGVQDNSGRRCQMLQTTLMIPSGHQPNSLRRLFETVDRQSVTYVTAHRQRMLGEVPPRESARCVQSRSLLQ
jgi:hypothetical protein